MSDFATVLGLGQLFDGLMDIRNAIEASDSAWVVGTNVEYAVYVEFGTRYMEAQPYLREAVREVMSGADQLAAKASSTDELVQLIALAVERRAKDHVPVDTGNLRSSIEARKI
jgi:hypothetical protein